MTVPRSKWVWCGYAGHFIGARNCLMHMHTRVGDYRISTVGDYRPRPDRPAEPIGAGEDAMFETFVFPVIGFGHHGEGEVTDWCEIDSERYATAEDAEAGHLAFCVRYAKEGKR